MCTQRAIYALAGTMILMSLTLATLVSPWWLLLTVFVGANLLQSAITGICPAEWVFRKVGLKPQCGCPDSNPVR